MMECPLNVMSSLLGHGHASIERVSSIACTTGGRQVMAIEEEANHLQAAGGSQQTRVEWRLGVDGERIWPGGHDGPEMVVERRKR